MPASTFEHLPTTSRKKAIKLQNKIDALKAKLDGMVGDVVIPGEIKVDGRKGKRSAATRAKMVAAAKARWAAKNGTGTPKVGTRKRRIMSPEAKAKIAAAQRARWAKAKS